MSSADGVWSATSPDGIHWTKSKALIMPSMGDTVGFFYDSIHEKYVCFAKRYTDRGRSRFQCESKDFLNWTNPHLIMKTDDKDDQPCDFYNNTGFVWDKMLLGWYVFKYSDDGGRSWSKDRYRLPLRDGRSLFCMFRTTMGYPACSYSRDAGKTWSRPQPARYRPGGRIMRHPRACPMVWRCKNGNYLFWFHNNGFQGFKTARPRNLAWLAAGVEHDGVIHWSQPELIRYDDHSQRGSSYPDLIEDGGNYYICSAQKTAARIAQVDATLLEDLWNQDTLSTVARKGLLLNLDEGELLSRRSWSFDSLPRLDRRGGFTIGLRIRLQDLKPGRVLVDGTGGAETGFRVLTAADGTLEINFHDGKRGFSWTSDPGTIKAQTLQHVVFIVDGGPNCVSVVVDGRLCDGGQDDRRRYGYGRFGQTKYFGLYDERSELAEEIGDVTGAGQLTAPAKGEVLQLRLYSRYLRTSEAIGNWRAN